MIGTTISHYTIVEKLGEGGMGVVYKATDTKLDRTVALKFLPDHVTVGSGELERFVQEAKAAAGLNHPNICTIYGIEESENQHFIVMEYVDGQTLQEKKSSLSMKQALDVGIQIAEGLAAAHEKGIVHRDIKPENIMFRKDGRVQIMDFGLAKLRGASRLTKEGSTVGTAGYMSPEQVQGQETDHRSDIFSLGVLLYEMLSGQPPFKGIHETAIAYEIVNVDSPPLSSIKPDIPPELDAIVLDCLEKDPKERTQSAGQVALELKRYRRESSRSRASRITAARPAGSRATLETEGTAWRSSQITPSWKWTGLIAFAMLLVGFGLSFLLPKAEVNTPVMRAAINMPPGIHYSDGVGGSSAISPDGSSLTFVGIDSSTQSHLWVQSLAASARMLAGTENALYPFWSPDGKSLGFFADGKLKTIPAAGGPVVVVADAPFGRGAAWSSNGTIIFSPNVQDQSFLAVSASGGDPYRVIKFDSPAGLVPRFPSFLPDGDHFLFTMINLTTLAPDAYVASLKGNGATMLLRGALNPVFSCGSLLFVRQGILMAQPFDPDSRSVKGEPVSIQGSVNGYIPRGKADYSSAASRTLLYSSGSNTRDQELFWVDQAGTVKFITKISMHLLVTLSPDGDRVAYDKETPGGVGDIWIYDIASSVTTRLTFSGMADRPVWSHDGSKVYYNIDDTTGIKSVLYVRRADGSGDAQLLAREESAQIGYYPLDESPDGKYLLIEISNQSRSELAVVDLAANKPAPVKKLNLQGSSARFSPNGQLIVYQTSIRDIPGRILVSRFLGTPGTWEVAPGGSGPMWTQEGISFFSAGENRQNMVSVTLHGGGPVFGQPRALFPSSVSTNIFAFGYSSVRRKFIGLREASAGLNSQLSVITNWPALVK